MDKEVNDKEIEQHARDFLNYVAVNEKRLKKNLRKNITFNEDYFDEAFNDSIIKCYNYIINKKKHIDDFEQFFFIVSKNTYICIDNKEKNIKNTKVEVSQSFSIIDEKKEDRTEDIKKFINWLHSYLDDYFDSSQVDLFLIYFKLKSGKGKMSYSKLSKITNLSYAYICNSIKEIKLFCKQDKEIMKRYNKLIE